MPLSPAYSLGQGRRPWTRRAQSELRGLSLHAFLKWPQLLQTNMRFGTTGRSVTSELPSSSTASHRGGGNGQVSSGARAADGS